MKKNYKLGITLPVLVATIVIAIIIISTTVVSYDNIKESTLKKEFANEIYSVQKLVDNYKFMNNVYPISEETIDSSALQSLSEATLVEDEEFKVIDLYEAGVDEITRGINKVDNDLYIVSITTGKVYYLKGEKIGNNTYYYLNDELKSQVGLSK